MNEEKLIEKLKTLRMRVSLIEAIRQMKLTLPIGVGLSFALGVTLWLTRSPHHLSPLPLIIPLLHLIYRLLKPIDLCEVARRLDSTFSLEERVSTACELIEGRIKSDLRGLVVGDALRHLERIDPEKLKIRFPIPALVSSALIPVLTVFWLIPERQIHLPPRQIERMHAVAESIEIVPTSQLPGDLRREVRRTVKVLKRGEMDKSRALKRLAELESTVRERVADAERAERIVNEIKALLKNTPLPFSIESIESSSKLIERIADQVESGDLPPQMLPQIESALRRLFERLKSLDGELAVKLRRASEKPLDPTSLRELAKALKEFESKVNDLELLRLMLARIEEGKVEIGMLGIETPEAEGGFASEEGTPGETPFERKALGTKGKGAEFSPEGKPGETRPEEFTGGTETGPQPPRGRMRFELPGGEGIGGRPSEVKPGSTYTAESRLPTEGEIAEARKAASAVISSHKIPPLYREVVKRYFSSITPEGR